ncbi:hypothetical protein ABK040_008770 [Willaertia magna]
MPVKVVLQNVNNASLLIDNKDEWKSIENKGVILFVSFLKDTTSEEVTKIVKLIFESKIIPIENGKESILNFEKFDIMIVPQASLAGKLKNKQMQYHSLIDKELGKQLYEQFVRECKELVKAGSTLVEGTYGNRQGLKFESDGPYSHIIEL